MGQSIRNRADIFPQMLVKSKVSFTKERNCSILPNTIIFLNIMQEKNGNKMKTVKDCQDFSNNRKYEQRHLNYKKLIALLYEYRGKIYNSSNFHHIQTYLGAVFSKQNVDISYFIN